MTKTVFSHLSSKMKCVLLKNGHNCILNGISYN